MYRFGLAVNAWVLSGFLLFFCLFVCLFFVFLLYRPLLSEKSVVLRIFELRLAYGKFPLFPL